ncbi:hypothetical protein NBM05_00075 [Rothia sp. AR01]|uniref:Uncharacterized protein n=1 Tax=Rothia santali TaxID=2949643 RepID=A0A9X2HAA8_9MICC|nr:hypothetical protein [Rothia santali]MCP3424470.1 hypothetical protein [Rothia santali]
MYEIIAGYLAPLVAASTLLVLLVPVARRHLAPSAPTTPHPAFWVPENPRLEVHLDRSGAPSGALALVIRNGGQERTLRVTGTLTVGHQTQPVRVPDLWAGEQISQRLHGFPLQPQEEPASRTAGPVPVPASVQEATPAAAPLIAWDLSWRTPDGRTGRELGTAPLALPGRASAATAG